jgi:hypothetical protein
VEVGSTGDFDVCLDLADVAALTSLITPIRVLGSTIAQSRLWLLLPIRVRQNIVFGVVSAVKRALQFSIRNVLLRITPTPQDATKLTEALGTWYEELFGQIAADFVSGHVDTSKCTDTWRPTLTVTFEPDGDTRREVSESKALLWNTEWVN